MGLADLAERSEEQRLADWKPLVLLVDDSAAQRQLLAIYLRRFGCDVIEAASGEEALLICQTQKIDVVISDLMMPGLSGIDFCRAFRALPRDSYGYFILLTSNSERAAVALGLEAGADDFVTKPVSAEELRGRLRPALRILTMQSELMVKNRQIAAALREQKRLFGIIERDLIEARKLQLTLMPESYRDFGQAGF